MKYAHDSPTFKFVMVRFYVRFLMFTKLNYDYYPHLGIINGHIVNEYTGFLYPVEQYQAGCCNCKQVALF